MRFMKRGGLAGYTMLSSVCTSGECEKTLSRLRSVKKICRFALIKAEGEVARIWSGEKRRTILGWEMGRKTANTTTVLVPNRGFQKSQSYQILFQ